MKRRLLLCFILFFIVTMPAFSRDYSLGFYTWYADFVVGDGFSDDNYAFPGFLLGPFFEAELDSNLSASVLILMGSFERDRIGGGGAPAVVPSNGIFNTFHKDIKRYDIDLCLNYDLTKYIRPFAGVKFGYFDFSFKGDDGYHRSIGGALGLGFTIPIFYNFYLLGNGSFLYSMVGEHKFTLPPGPPGGGGELSPTADFSEVGFNSAVSLAYYFVPWSVTLSIGGRLQWVKVKYEEMDASFQDHFENGVYHFQGVTASVIKSF